MKSKGVFVVVLVVAVLMATIGVASANLKLVDVLHAWDDKWARWENGDMVLFLNGVPEPFYQVLNFDDNAVAADSCPGKSTAWAGEAQIGLYHTDNNPDGAKGFQSTKSWSLVKCSAFPKNQFVPAGDILANCTSAPGACQLVGAPDQVIACTSGNCKNEIDTSFKINIDANCDGIMDAPFKDAGDLCLYWEAVKPPLGGPYWGGNIQARVSILVDGAFTGDKTANFKVEGPNAVGLSRFTAGSAAFPVAAVAGLVVLVSAAMVVLPRRRR